ncbi:hypothetical protein [Rhodococcus sp. NPDC047139]|uniref:hypothetical protein n=1 Tax=Rhodococcus sp. NPDC047139 TaxID=3155141 RepID=UPI00340A7BC2
MAGQTVRRTAAALLTAGAVGTAMIAAAGVAQAAPTSTTMTCSSANPLFWAPPFTWTVHAASGESAPPDGPLEPSLLLSGGNELPIPPGGLLPTLGINWYGTQVLVDWHNRNTGQSGRSVSDREALQQHPRIPVNRTWTGTGTVDFTVTLQTGAGWWFVNTQNAVCKGTIDIVQR